MIFGKYAAIAGAVTLAVAWPFATGKIGQNIYERQIEDFNAPVLDIESISYDRGYLKSNAVTRLTFKDEIRLQLEEAGLPWVYDIQHQIQHGVLGVSSVNTFVLTPELKLISDKVWPDNPTPMTFTTSTKVTGETDFTFLVSPLSLTEEGSNVTASEMNFDGNVSPEGAVAFTYSMPAASFNSAVGEQLKIEALEGQGEGRMENDIWLGSQTLTAKSFTFVDAMNQTTKMLGSSLTISNLKQASEEGQRTLLDNDNVLRIDEIQLMNDVSFSDIALGVNFRDIDFEEMARLSALSSTINEDVTPEEMAVLADTLDALVAKGLTLSLEPAQVVTSDGKIEANIVLNVAEGGVGAVNNDISILFDNLTGKVTLNVPRQLLVNQPPLGAIIDQLAGYGFVSQQEEITVVEANIVGDQAESPTGERIPLVMFAMLMM